MKSIHFFEGPVTQGLLPSRFGLRSAASGPNLAPNEPFKKVRAYSASSARQETESAVWEILLAPRIGQRCGQDAGVCLTQVIVHLRRARVTLFSMSSVVKLHYSRDANAFLRHGRPQHSDGDEGLLELEPVDPGGEAGDTNEGILTLRRSGVGEEPTSEDHAHPCDQ